MGQSLPIYRRLGTYGSSTRLQEPSNGCNFFCSRDRALKPCSVLTNSMSPVILHPIWGSQNQSEAELSGFYHFLPLFTTFFISEFLGLFLVVPRTCWDRILVKNLMYYLAHFSTQDLTLLYLASSTLFMFHIIIHGELICLTVLQGSRTPTKWLSHVT